MRINILINPERAECVSIMHHVSKHFPHDHLEMYQTSARSVNDRRPSESLCRPSDILIAVGGDGTVNEAINRIAGTRTVLAIIPRGTANDLATLYGLPGNITDACEIIKKRKFTRINLIAVNGCCYATAGGIGYSSKVVELANRLKKSGPAKNLGSGIYILASILALNSKAHRANLIKLTADDGQEFLNAFSVFVNNQEYLGRRIKITPGAGNRDSYFNMCIIKNPLSRLEVVRLLLRSVKGSHGTLPYVKFRQTSFLRIESESKLKYFGDGEILAEGFRFDLRLIPLALKLAVASQYGDN